MISSGEFRARGIPGPASSAGEFGWQRDVAAANESRMNPRTLDRTFPNRSWITVRFPAVKSPVRSIATYVRKYVHTSLPRARPLFSCQRFKKITPAANLSPRVSRHFWTGFFRRSFSRRSFPTGRNLRVSICGAENRERTRCTEVLQTENMKRSTYTRLEENETKRNSESTICKISTCSHFVAVLERWSWTVL